MKTYSRIFAVILFFSFAILTTVSAQERPKFLTVTTIHWNLNYKNFNMDEWKAMEKKYFDNVTMKNEFINNSLVLLHYFTADNSEIKIVTGYKSWEDIEKAEQRSDELEKATWPDEQVRKDFFKKRSAYYGPSHSDEIYSTLDGAKVLAKKSADPLVYYIRDIHTAWPEDGKTEEIEGMVKEFNENVTFKNKYIKAYYPSRHAWGSDGRDLIEAIVVGSLADLENGLQENQNLIKAHWPDETKRKAFFARMNEYNDGWHGDFIYHNVPELTKN